MRPYFARSFVAVDAAFAPLMVVAMAQTGSALAVGIWALVGALAVVLDDAMDDDEQPFQAIPGALYVSANYTVDGDARIEIASRIREAGR